MSNQNSVAAVKALATEAGAWINDPLKVIVRNAKPGGVGANNKPKPSKCVLVDVNDPQATLAACWFGGNFMQYDDKIIEISGKSNKVSVYRGSEELSIGKEGIVALIGPAPSGAPSGHSNAPQGGGNNPPTPPQEKGDPSAVFHRGMQKIALLLAHSIQYARNVEAISGEKFTDDRLQATVSSIFITAKDQGALVKPLPKLRAVDEKGIPFRFVPEQPDPEAAKRAAEEAAKRAAEEARLKAEAAERERQANLDEDVPF